MAPPAVTAARVARWEVRGWRVAARARCSACGAVKVVALPDACALSTPPRGCRRAHAASIAARLIGPALVPHHAAALAALADAVAAAACARMRLDPPEGPADPAPFALELRDLVSCARLTVDGLSVVTDVRAAAGEAALRAQLVLAARECGATDPGEVDAAAEAVCASWAWRPVG